MAIKILTFLGEQEGNFKEDLREQLEEFNKYEHIYRAYGINRDAGFIGFMIEKAITCMYHINDLTIDPDEEDEEEEWKGEEESSVD